MTADFESQVGELMELAEGLDDGPSKLALLEEAVRLADAHRQDRLGDSLRKELIRSATFGGAPEKALVAFTWRLALADRDPKNFPERALLWEYKWIMGAVAGFPQITREQIEQMLEDMTRRYRRCGMGLHPVYVLRCKIAMSMCRTAEARKFYRQWKKTPRDWGSDCLACQCDHEVKYHLQAGKDEEALEAAGPILKGSLRCAEIPQATYAHVLLPLLRLGRLDEAMAYHARGYRMVANNRNFLEEVTEHLVFLALTDNLAKAVKLLEKHLPWALESKHLRLRFEFYLAARFLLERMGEAGKAELKLRLPADFPAFREEGRYEVAALEKWFDGACRELAERFDARNGNDGFVRRMRAARRWKKLVTPCPLRPARKSGEGTV